MTKAFTAAVAASLLVCVGAWGQEPAKLQYDLVIRNGRVMDGSGQPAVRADVAIKGGRIVAIGAVAPGSAAEEIDAGGRAVAPGFIDVHTHVDGEIHTSPAAENFVRDGVTTIVCGNCGGSVKDVAAYFARIRERGAGVDVATLYGHNTVLKEVKGDRKGELTAEQMERAKELVRKAMREGAVGLSTGLIYNPGQFSSTEEIVELAKVASEFGGIYASHIRGEHGTILKAIDEVITIAREAHVRCEISHFKLPTDVVAKVGGSNVTLGRVMAARQAGLEIGLDQYPYTASSTGISTLIPDEFLEQGIEGARKHIQDPAEFDRVLAAMLNHAEKIGRKSMAYVVVASCPTVPEYNGKSVEQIAQMRKANHDAKEGGGELLGDAAAKPTEVSMEEQCRAVLEVFKTGNVSCVFHMMNDAEVENIIRSPLVAIASDSGIRNLGVGVPHPRGYGTNCRVLGRYVREKKLFSM